ncbi:hypothetical protein SNEBB_010079 [Seison nebaliae]|nr:hypothetical protein SNEBB_010079 [Seison nebaliae]
MLPTIRLMIIFHIIIIFLLEFGRCNLSQECLDCMCEKESHCKPLKCRAHEGTTACGYYQMKPPFYQDCGSPGNSLEECALDKNCADQCVKAYLKRYGKYCAGDVALTCSIYARILNGGPKGCQNPNTQLFAQSIVNCANKKGSGSTISTNSDNEAKQINPSTAKTYVRRLVRILRNFISKFNALL